MSLATAAARAVALGPYQGKESSETALLRTLLGELPADAVVVGDRCFCSYFMVALLSAHGLQAVVRLHQRRQSDRRRGRRLGVDDYLVTWSRPERPEWMDAATYASMPETIQVRQIYKEVNKRGYRVKHLTVVTTLLAADTYTRDEVASLYHQRWQVEMSHPHYPSSASLYGGRWAA